MHALPPPSPVVEELAHVIGRPLAEQLAGAWAGTALYIPKSIAAEHPIARTIGPTAAQALAAFAGGQWLKFPLPRRVRARVLELARARPKLKRSEIARRAGTTERHVYRVLREEEERASAQPQLRLT